MRLEPESTTTGLRVRAKARRRRAILHAALRLFAERGYEHTSIQDIAAAAEVAPRTVAGYFPAKLDFVTAWPAALSNRMIALYEQQPGIGFVDLLDRCWQDIRDSVDPEEAALTQAMTATNPAIVAMARAEVGRRAREGGFSLPGHPDPGEETVVQRAGRAAIDGIDGAFLRAVAEGRMTDDVQAALLELVSLLVEQSGAGHGALRFES